MLFKFHFIIVLILIVIHVISLASLIDIDDSARRVKGVQLHVENVISFTDIERSYPQLTKIFSISVTATTVSIVANVSHHGNIFCFPDDSNSTMPKDGGVEKFLIFQHGIKTIILRAGISKFSLTELSPETHYTLYCQSQNFFNTASMPFHEAVANRITFRTECCKAVAVDFVPSYIMQFGTPNIVPETIFSARLNAHHNYEVSFSASFQFVACPWNITRYNLKGTNIGGKIRMYPSVLKWPSISALADPNNDKLEFVIRSQIEGCFQVNLIQLKGYGINQQFRNQSFFLQVISRSDDTVPIPSPLLIRSQYSIDGRYLEFDFDSLTDRASSILSSQERNSETFSFNCSSVLKFVSAVYSLCRWESNSRIIAKISSKTGIIATPVGTKAQIVMLNKNKIVRPLCQVQEGIPCHVISYEKSPSNTVVVSSPSNFITPSVKIVSTSRVSYCDIWRIDPTQSIGNGNRPWSEVLWSVVAVDQSTGDVIDARILEEFLQENYQTTAYTIAVPSSKFENEVIYSITLKLTNYLGAFSVSGFTTEISGYKVTPQVIIHSSKQVNILRSDILNAEALISVPSCPADDILLTANERSVDGEKGNLIKSRNKNVDDEIRLTSTNLELVGFLYSWKLFEEYFEGDVGEPQFRYVNIKSIAKASNRFQLPPFSLNHSTNYMLLVEVSYDQTDNLFFTTGFSTINVQVKPPLVEAIISGGQAQAVTNVRPFSFDASSSKNSLSPNTSSLLFSWNCMEYAPNFGDGCDFKPSQSAIQSFRASSLKSNKVYIVTLAVRNSLGYESKTSVKVSVVGSQSPRVQITEGTQAMKRYNVDNEIIIEGEIDSLFNVQGFWTCQSGCSNGIASLSRYSTTRMNYAGISVFPLILAVNVLNPGQSYSFTLTAGIATAAMTSATVFISINDVPRDGVFNVNPTFGSSLSTSFEFSSRGWIDDLGDYPLSFGFFCYTISSDSRYPVKEMSYLSYSISFLSQGIGSKKFLISCVADVIDLLGGRSTSSLVGVTVRPTYSLSSLTTEATATEVKKKMEDAESGRNISFSLQLIQSISASMNAVDCGQIPFKCSTINRFDCASTPQTCGPCISTSFIGPRGDSNIPCLSNRDLQSRSLIGQSCRSDSNCASNFCRKDGSLQVCAYPEKKCWNNCNGKARGTCTFFNYLGDPQASNDKCLTSNLFCEARCVCKPGYSGIDCQLTSNQLMIAQDIRSNLCTRLLNTNNNPDITLSYGVISSKALIVSDIFSTDAGQIKETAVQNCVALLVDSLLDNPDISPFFGVSESSTHSLDAITNVIEALSKSLLYQDSLNKSPDLQEVIAYTLSLLSLKIQASLFVGAEPVSLIYDNLRMKIVMSRMDDLSALDLSLPRSSYEEALGINAGEVSVDTSMLLSRTRSLGVSISQHTIGSSIPLFSKSLTNTTAIGVDVVSYKYSSGSQLTSGESLTWTLSLKHFSDITYRTYEQSYSQVICNRLSSSNYQQSITCPSGQKVEITCPANQKGAFNVTCPAYKMEPKCSSWDGGSFSVDSSCSLVYYSSSEVVCKCVMLMENNNLPAISKVTARRLSSNPIPFDTWTTKYYSSSIVIYSSLPSQLFSSYPIFRSDLDDSIFVGTIAIISMSIFTLILIIVIRQMKSTKKSATSSSDAEEKSDHISEEKSKQFNISQASRHRTIRSFYDEFIPVVLRPETAWTSRIWYYIRLQSAFLQIFQKPDDGNKSDRIKTSPGAIGEQKVKSVIEYWWDVIRLTVISVFLAVLAINDSFNDDGSCEEITSKDSCLTVSTYGRLPWLFFASPSTLINGCNWNEKYSACVFHQPALLLHVPVITVVVFFLAILLSIIYRLTTPILTFQSLWSNMKIVARDWYDYVHKIRNYFSTSDGRGTFLDPVETIDVSNYAGYSYDEFSRCQNMRGKMLAAARLGRLVKQIDSIAAQEEVRSINREIESLPKLFLSKFHRLEVPSSSNYNGGSRNVDIDRDTALNTTAFHKDLSHLLRTNLVRRNAKLLTTLLVMRKKSTSLLQDILSISDFEIREKRLMTAFVLECLPKYCQGNGKDLLNVNSFLAYTQRPTFLSILKDTVISLTQLATISALVIYSLAVTRSIGSKSFPLWIILTISLLLEAFLFLPILSGLLQFLIHQPTTTELSKIFAFLALQSRMVMTRSRGQLPHRGENILVQHLNASCRVARYFPELPIARILLLINDSDLLFQKYAPVSRWSDWVAMVASRIGKSGYVLFTCLPTSLQNVIIHIICFAFMNGSIMSLHFLAKIISIPAVVVISIALIISMILWTLRRNIYDLYIQTTFKRRREKAKEEKKNKIYSHDHYSDQLERIKQLSEFHPSYNNSARVSNSITKFLFQPATMSEETTQKNLSSLSENADSTVTGSCYKLLTCCLSSICRGGDAVVVPAEFSTKDFHFDEDSVDEANSDHSLGSEEHEIGYRHNGALVNDDGTNRQFSIEGSELVEVDDFSDLGDLSLTSSLRPLRGPPLAGAPMASFMSSSNYSNNLIRPSIDKIQLADFEPSQSLMDNYGSINELSNVQPVSEINVADSQDTDKEGDEERDGVEEDEGSNGDETKSEDEDEEKVLAADENNSDTGDVHTMAADIIASSESMHWSPVILDSVIKYKTAKENRKFNRFKLASKVPIMCRSDDYDFYDYHDIAYRVHIERGSQSRRRNLTGGLRQRDVDTHNNRKALNHMIYTFEASMIVTEMNFRRANEKKNRAKRLRLREFAATGPGHRIPLQELNLVKSPYTLLCRYMFFTEDCDLSVGDIVMSGIDAMEKLPRDILCDGKAIMNREAMSGKGKWKDKLIDAQLQESSSNHEDDEFKPTVVKTGTVTSAAETYGHEIKDNLAENTVDLSLAIKDNAVKTQPVKFLPYAWLNHDAPLDSIDDFIYQKTIHKLWVEEVKKN